MLKVVYFRVIVVLLMFACVFTCFGLGQGASRTCSGFSVNVGNAVGGEVGEVEKLRLPIVMYHKLLKSSKGKYTVSPEQLEADFRAFRDAGFVAVFMREVIDWVDGVGELPDKPIVITFDDGHYNNIYYGLDIAKRYGMKFVISPVTSFSRFSETSGDHSNPNYSHLTSEQIRLAVDSGLVEIGNHTHAMHRFKPRFGISRLKGEGDDEYRVSLIEDIEKAQKFIEASGVARPVTFAWPFGKYTTEARDILIDEFGFRAFLTCNEWVNTVTRGRKESLYGMILIWKPFH